MHQKMALRLTSASRLIRNIVAVNPVRCMSGEWGSGVGKGGGAGGSVREAGGSFGKMEAAREEEYFRKLQAQQLAALRDHHQEELKAHEESIQQHIDAIERHKKKINELEQLDKKKDDSDSD